MDAEVTKGPKELERLTADARGPFELGLGCGLLAGRQAASLGLGRLYGQAVGHQHRGGATDARGPFELGQGCGLLAEWKAAGFGLGRLYS